VVQFVAIEFTRFVRRCHAALSRSSAMNWWQGNAQPSRFLSLLQQARSRAGHPSFGGWRIGVERTPQNA